MAYDMLEMVGNPIVRMIIEMGKNVHVLWRNL